MDVARLDFQQLRIKHLAFKSKVRSVLYGGNYDSKFFHHDNPVSQWFATVGSQHYHAAPEMQLLNRLHRDIAALAVVLIAKYRSDLIDQAHEGMEELGELSDRFLKALSDLELRYA